MKHIINLAKYAIILSLSTFTMFYYLNKYTETERGTEAHQIAGAEFIITLCIGYLLSPFYCMAILGITT